MQYHLSYDMISHLWYTTLLGGEFANCYGQGTTPEEAEVSLKIRVYQLRRKRDNEL